MVKSTVSMKLLIDGRINKVVFAEADKDCVDFLFQLLSLPVATIIRLLEGEGMEGCSPNLYQSLEDLDHAYILPKKDKNALLNPAPSCSVPLLAIQDASTNSNQLVCSNCRHQLAPEDGLVKGVVKYLARPFLQEQDRSYRPLLLVQKRLVGV